LCECPVISKFVRFLGVLDLFSSQIQVDEAGSQQESDHHAGRQRQYAFNRPGGRSGLLKKARDLGVPLVSVNGVQFHESRSSRSKKEKKMNTTNGSPLGTNKKTTEMKDMKVIFSTLWVFVTVNYLYCDVMTLMDPVLLKQFITGTVGVMQVTQGFLLGAAILMEIPMAMILLSRVLKYRANRWANIIAGTIMTAVQSLSLFTGTPTLYYIFFSIIEIACTSVVVWYAWKWTNPEVSPNNKI
jgi:hypothetical protein